MDRRKFVAMMVAAGVVSSGLNAGCSKNETNSVNSGEIPNSPNISNNKVPENTNTPENSDNSANGIVNNKPKAPKDTPDKTPRDTPDKTPKDISNKNTNNNQATPRPTHEPIINSPGDEYTE